MLTTRQIWNRTGGISIEPTKNGHWNVVARRHNEDMSKFYGYRVSDYGSPMFRRKCNNIDEITSAVEEAMLWLSAEKVKSDRK